VEGAVKFLALLAVGLLFSWLAVLGWRHRTKESIGLLEAAILTTTDAEPLPLTKFDRWLQKFQLVMMTLFGPALVVIGGYGVLSEIGAI
jgi:hypothetical protein